MDKETIFTVIHIDGKERVLTDELFQEWLNYLSVLTNGLVSVDGIIAEQKTSCCLNLNGKEYNNAITKQLASLDLLKEDIDHFKSIIAPNE